MPINGLLGPETRLVVRPTNLLRYAGKVMNITKPWFLLIINLVPVLSFISLNSFPNSRYQTRSGVVVVELLFPSGGPFWFRCLDQPDPAIIVVYFFVSDYYLYPFMYSLPPWRGRPVPECYLRK